MALTVKYHNAMLPEGQEMDIGGVMVENGGSVELTREHEASLMSLSGQMPVDYLGASEDMEVSGTPFLKKEDLEVMHPQPVEGGVQVAELDEKAVAKEAAANKKAAEGGDTS
jgi:hypothetical protein